MAALIENPASVSLVSSSLNKERQLPVPPTGSSFESARNFVGSVLGGVINYAASSTISSSVGSTVLPQDFQTLLDRQMEVQRQMMLTSMVSNVQKSKHETEMAPVRNIRVG